MHMPHRPTDTCNHILYTDICEHYLTAVPTHDGPPSHLPLSPLHWMNLGHPVTTAAAPHLTKPLEIHGPPALPCFPHTQTSKAKLSEPY